MHSEKPMQKEIERGMHSEKPKGLPMDYYLGKQKEMMKTKAKQKMMEIGTEMLMGLQKGKQRHWVTEKEKRLEKLRVRKS